MFSVGPMSAHETLSLWEAFYVIVGSSAGALTGLQFVVIALIAESGTLAGSSEVAAFGTPTVFHFVGALLASAILSAPWHSYIVPAVCLAILGLFGSCYAEVVAMRARRAQAYKPVLEDWIWHVVLPMVAYIAMLAAGIMLPRFHDTALFIVAGCALLLVGIGIHNAWDTVIYVAMRMKGEQATARHEEPPAA